MRRLMVIAVLLAFCMAVSCAAIRKDLVKLSEEDLKNAETTRVVAKNLLSTWKLNSGFIKGALGARLNEMPQSVITTLQELDTLADKKDQLTDYDLGYSVGLRVRMLSTMVQQTLKNYAPEVLKYLPSFLAL